jgi:hypothetical protein
VVIDELLRRMPCGEEKYVIIHVSRRISPLEAGDYSLLGAEAISGEGKVVILKAFAMKR